MLAFALIAPGLAPKNLVSKGRFFPASCFFVSCFPLSSVVNPASTSPTRFKTARELSRPLGFALALVMRHSHVVRGSLLFNLGQL